MKKIPFLCLSFLLAAGLATSAPAQTPSSPLKSAMDHYLNIQNALARDSMENVAANANALAALARENQIEGLPETVAEEAAALAEARHISQAREAFKPLSRSMIACLKAEPAHSGTYYEFYCRPAKASWLQTGDMAMNPYLGWRAERPTWGWASSAVEKGEFAGR
jgi:hypothetical protein